MIGQFLSSVTELATPVAITRTEQSPTLFGHTTHTGLRKRGSPAEKQMS